MQGIKTRPHPEVGVWLAEQLSSKFPSRENNVARPCEKYDFTYLICPHFRPLYSFQLPHYLFVPFALNWSLLMHCSPQWPQMQTLLLWPLKCWDHMHVTLYPANFNQFLILFSIFCLYQCFSRYVIYYLKMFCDQMWWRNTSWNKLKQIVFILFFDLLLLFWLLRYVVLCSPDWPLPSYGAQADLAFLILNAGIMLHVTTSLSMLICTVHLPILTCHVVYDITLQIISIIIV